MSHQAPPQPIFHSSRSITYRGNESASSLDMPSPERKRTPTEMYPPTTGRLPETSSVPLSGQPTSSSRDYWRSDRPLRSRRRQDPDLMVKTVVTRANVVLYTCTVVDLTHERIKRRPVLEDLIHEYQRITQSPSSDTATAFSYLAGLRRPRENPGQSSRSPSISLAGARRSGPIRIISVLNSRYTVPSASMAILALPSASSPTGKS